jgi:hypothetical protein
VDQERDILLARLAAEILRVYWAAQIDEGSDLAVSLPVLDGKVKIEVSVQGGVFTVRSEVLIESALDPQEVHDLNYETPGASYVYLLDGERLWLQSKLLVPDLNFFEVRPDLLGLAWGAGWRAAGGIGQQQNCGPSSYEHFVYLADFLSAAGHEQWAAQQGVAAAAFGDQAIS